MKYDDIIDLPHHISTRRAHLSMAQRSAQFASFAVLKGFEDEIAETARVTDKKLILDENEIEILNEALQYISYNINENLEVSITYFVPDKLKSGGAYVTKKGTVKKIDTFNKSVTVDNAEIPVNDILKIEI
ncbi:YolD-like family protein [uncultured Eubacterium sp.]|uniref:YolD-like family protein n=1 Tax=uncultured Eubacterium sp. TaxID=165185 RepID=UPI002805F928|nr:YolD-like family protein [uncultured Eubacterium sp.]